MKYRFAVVMALAVGAAALIAACGSEADSPAIDPTSTPVPSTATPTSTPVPATATVVVPTSTPVSTATAAPTSTPTPIGAISSIDLDSLSCVNFHPGVPNPDGPNHWYDVSASLTNNGNETVPVLAEFVIMDSELKVLAEALPPVREIAPGQTANLFEKIELVLQANDFRCRLKIVSADDPDGVNAVASVDVESIFAP